MVGKWYKKLNTNCENSLCVVNHQTAENRWENCLEKRNATRRNFAIHSRTPKGRESLGKVDRQRAKNRSKDTRKSWCWITLNWLKNRWKSQSPNGRESNEKSRERRLTWKIKSRLGEMACWKIRRSGLYETISPREGKDWMSKNQKAASDVSLENANCRETGGQREARGVGARCACLWRYGEGRDSLGKPLEKLGASLCRGLPRFACIDASRCVLMQLEPPHCEDDDASLSKWGWNIINGSKPRQWNGRGSFCCSPNTRLKNLSPTPNFYEMVEIH